MVRLAGEFHSLYGVGEGIWWEEDSQSSPAVVKGTLTRNDFRGYEKGGGNWKEEETGVTKERVLLMGKTEVSEVIESESVAASPIISILI